jgi:hypothetical protein
MITGLLLLLAPALSIARRSLGIGNARRTQFQGFTCTTAFNEPPFEVFVFAP